MSLIPPGETVVETKSCRSCAATFPITDKDVEFYDKVSPVFNGKKENVPTPTLCPDCRQRRRLAFRNERKLYKRKCDLTGKDIISIYSPDKPYTVYEQSAWWGDGWDAMDYGREFDFEKGFLEQFDSLAHSVPKIGLFAGPTMADAFYCNYWESCDQCYLCVNCYNLQDCFYSTSCWANEGKLSDIVDSDACNDSSNMYASLDCLGCSKCFYSRSLRDCFECHYSRQLHGCSQCLGCINLFGKKLHILNRPVTEMEFRTTLENLLSDDVARDAFLKAFEHLKESAIYKASWNSNAENCTGDWIYDSKNVHSGFMVTSTENGKYIHTGGYLTKNMYDVMNAGGESDILYEAQHSRLMYCSAFLIDSDRLGHSYLCELCNTCRDCFACVGLRNKQYCILNKQYTKEEYEALVPKIIDHMRRTGEWGEFFSPNISPFGYNETLAYQLEPLTKEEALKLGFNWSDYEPPFPKVDKIIPASKLPENIADIPDDILNWAIECEVTKKPFRIIKQELDFYRKHNLPIPKRHPDQRHLDRLALRNPRKLFERKCDNCQKDMVTTYAPDRPERVYCEECYNKEVYG